mgnify:CR=1 FL=1
MNIGLFFGSFNPVHTGHMIIANHFAENADLHQVWFVISPQNPFKEKSSLLDEKYNVSPSAVGKNSSNAVLMDAGKGAGSDHVCPSHSAYHKSYPPLPPSIDAEKTNTLSFSIKQGWP